MPTKAKITKFLLTPFGDKLLAFLAVLPVFYNLYNFYNIVVQGTETVYSAGIALWGFVTLVFMLSRKPAKRVSVNPLSWVITAGRTYWIYFVLIFVSTKGTMTIAPLIVVHGILLLSLFIIIYSRFNLGRNVGYVPARRELVTKGMYGLMRHPIHTGQVLFFISYILAYYSPYNLLLIVIGISFIFAKSFIEEKFLMDDEDYREYCRKVRWRWIPGVV